LTNVDTKHIILTNVDVKRGCRAYVLSKSIEVYRYNVRFSMSFPILLSEIVALVEFVALAVWRIWPFFLISVSLGVIIRALKLDQKIRRIFDAQIGLSILLAVAVGAFSPFCSCGVSGDRALLLSGVPLTVMAFGPSPTMDPEIFALSVGTLGWPLATARLGATLLLSLGAGFITLALTRTGVLSGPALRPKLLEAQRTAPPAPAEALRQPAFVPMMSLTAAPAQALAGAGGGCGCGDRRSQGEVCTPATPVTRGGLAVLDTLRGLDWPHIGKDVLRESALMGRWLLVAFLLEALITRYVPQQGIASVLGRQNAFAIPLAALIGVPLYLSNLMALPIVSGLLAQGMQPGAAIAFLVGGSLTTFPAMAAVWGIVRGRVFALYLGIALIGSMLVGYLVNVILG
jgi:uncharacterized membrane protein YraQ (UPF0718 family)